MSLIPTIWQKRLGAFNDSVDGYLKWLRKSTPPRQQTAEVLLDNLKKFTQRQFTRFDNFQAYLDLSPKPIIPFLMPDTILCLILDQAFTDFSVIQQAISQRQVDNMKEVLDIADQLAWLALVDPVRKYLDSPNTTVLTYLHKSTNVRLIPYAPVAVVGIPYTGIMKAESERLDINTTVTQDYLGIPHEIGHHVFWHCNINPDEQENPLKLFDYLKGALQDDDAFVARWAEEIFADMYGLAIGGPLIAKAGQSVQKVIAADKFFSDDGEHPTSALRPRIAAKILQDLEYGQSDILLQDWLAICESRKACLWMNESNAVNDWFKVYEDAQWVPIDWVMGSTTNLNSQKAVDRMTSKLLGLDITASVKGLQTWWNGYLGVSGKSSLYDMFDAYIQQTILRTPPTTGLDTINADNWHPDMDSLSPEIEQRPNYEYTEPVLRFILKINGWATKGADRDPIPRLSD